jgi:hypothetical protein
MTFAVHRSRLIVASLAFSLRLGLIRHVIVASITRFTARAVFLLFATDVSVLF